ncbi:MAG: hypothetical protein KC897_07680 [Candidatus Omnitrophica bacterium]|nr:hypothetical protein [Candidatus Omnitrophota bacterium]MCB9720960.1 hypothetical protein [Candidatus Omnitrophota bacterium]
MKPNPIVLILCTICPLLLLAHVPPAHGQLPGNLGPDYIVDRFNQERRRIIRYAEVLGLNDRQSEKIDELSRHLEKEMVLQDARVEVIDIDLRAELSKDQVDMKQVRKLLAEKFEIERKRTEGQAAAYASLKEILSQAQREKLRGTQEIFRGPYGRGSGDEE